MNIDNFNDRIIIVGEKMIFKKGKNQNEDVNASIEQDNNMYSEFEEKPSNVDNKNNMAYSNTSNSSNSFNDQPYAYKEKEYKTNTLEEHTTVTNSSRMSKVLLYGFYLVFIVIGLIVFIMIRSNKYEFYLKEEEITVLFLGLFSNITIS